MLSIAQQIEQLAGLGILVVALGLATLSGVAWARERDSRMLIVTIAYAMFAFHGLVLFLEYFLVGVAIPVFGNIELVEHTSSLLVLVGLLAFFVAITRE